MNRSDSLEKFAPAFVKAQREVKGARKSSVNPHFKSRYADLAEVEDACLDALNAQGIAVLQPVRSDGPTAIVTTLLLHESGEWLSEDLGLTAVQNTPQALGSAITYGRRYGLAAMVGVAPEDDDGNAATTQASGYSQERPVVSATPAAPAGPAQDAAGHLYVRRVDAKPTKKPGVTRYTVQLSTGEYAATINERFATLAKDACREERPVAVQVKSTPYGPELAGIMFDGPEAERELVTAGPYSDPPLDDADIPL